MPEVEEAAQFAMGDGASLRALLIDGQPWFVAADLAAALGYSRVADMARLADDDQRGTRRLRTPGGAQECLIVNEPGLYAIIMRGSRPDTKAFQRWVTSEVLPTLRATGVYGTPKSRVDWARALLAAEERAATLETVVDAIGPSAAAWEHLTKPRNGGWSLSYVPQILRRDPAIRRLDETNRGRPDRCLIQLVRESMFRTGLFDWDQADRRFRPSRRATDNGLVVVDDGGAIRVSPQALTLIHKDLGGSVSVDALLVRETMEIEG